METQPITLRSLANRQVSCPLHRMKLCFFWVFLLGLVAHGYALLNFTINHDSLNEFYLADSQTWKLVLGRILSPALRYLTGEIMALPWLDGLLGLTFIALSAYGISQMFALDRNWQIGLLAGILVTNMPVTALIASYIHDFSCDILALLFSVLTALMWYQMGDRFSLKKTLLGSLCLFGSLIGYQSYVNVTLTLMCISSIFQLLEGRSPWAVIRRRLLAVPMAAVAAAAYWGLLQWIEGQVPWLHGNFWAAKEALEAPATLLENLVRMYAKAAGDLFLPNYGSSAQGVFSQGAAVICLVNGLLLVLSLGMMGYLLHRGSVKPGGLVLLVLLLAGLPGAMMAVNILSGVHHNLTRYAVHLFYLLPLALFAQLCRQHPIQKPGRLAVPACVMIGLVIFSNIQMANVTYIRKDVQQQATMSTMTRVLSLLEAYPDYQYGQSQVAILGEVDGLDVDVNSGGVDNVVGIHYRSQISCLEVMDQYFSVVLQYPIRLTSLEEGEAIMQTEAYQKMPAFPRKGCIATLDGVIVVKMSQ